MWQVWRALGVTNSTLCPHILHCSWIMIWGLPWKRSINSTCDVKWFKYYILQWKKKKTVIAAVVPLFLPFVPTFLAWGRGWENAIRIYWNVQVRSTVGLNMCYCSPTSNNAKYKITGVSKIQKHSYIPNYVCSVSDEFSMSFTCFDCIYCCLAEYKIRCLHRRATFWLNIYFCILREIIKHFFGKQNYFFCGNLYDSIF